MVSNMRPQLGKNKSRYEQTTQLARNMQGNQLCSTYLSQQWKYAAASHAAHTLYSAATTNASHEDMHKWQQQSGPSRLRHRPAAATAGLLVHASATQMYLQCTK